MENKAVIRVQFNSRHENRDELEAHVKTYIEAMNKAGYKVLYKITIQASCYEVATVIFMAN